MPCSGIPCCLKNSSGQLLQLPSSPSRINRCKETNFIAFGKGFSTATNNNCLHFCWQITGCFLDGVGTTFAVDWVNFLPYFSAVLTTPPSKRLVPSFSFCSLPSHCCIQREGSLCCVPPLFAAVVASSSSDSFPGTRWFWLVLITFSTFIINFPWFSFLSQCIFLIPLATIFLHYWIQLAWQLEGR